MNRLTVYSYLTRYPYGHSGSGKLFTIPLPDSNIPVKMTGWTRHKLTDNYQILVLLVHITFGRQRGDGLAC